jgi:hypothetical protein
MLRAKQNRRCGNICGPSAQPLERRPASVNSLGNRPLTWARAIYFLFYEKRISKTSVAKEIINVNAWCVSMRASLLV